jgi:hypothetical protein
MTLSASKVQSSVLSLRKEYEILDDEEDTLSAKSTVGMILEGIIVSMIVPGAIRDKLSFRSFYEQYVIESRNRFASSSSSLVRGADSTHWNHIWMHATVSVLGYCFLSTHQCYISISVYLLNIHFLNLSTIDFRVRSSSTGAGIERGDAVAEIDGIRATPNSVVALLRGPDAVGSPVAVALEKGGPGGRRALFVLHRASMRGVVRVGRCCVGLAELAGEVARSSPDRRVRLPR